MADEEFACVPRAGRQLWAIRIRFWFYRALHLLANRKLHESGSGRFCWHWDDAELERLVHDHDYHRRIPSWANWQPVKATGPPSD